MNLNAKTSYLILSLTCLTASSIFAAEDSQTFIPKKIISGRDHTCILSTEGQVKCWGNNASGTLGLGSTIDRGRIPGTMGPNLPVVDLGKDIFVRDMCAGESFSCALTSTGHVKCWGDNRSGQLGQEIATTAVGSASNQMGDQLPITNLGTDFVATDVQCGRAFACALDTKGKAKCWGDNSFHQLGSKIEGRSNIGTKTGDMGDKLPYLPLPSLQSVSIGGSYVCAATSTAVHCWGDNSFGRIGIESQALFVVLPTNAQDAVQVKMEENGVSKTIVSMTSGSSHTCVEYSVNGSPTKKIKCWGSNSSGELGIGLKDRARGGSLGTMGSKLPALPLDASHFSQIEAYSYFSCALKRNGMVQCWGLNNNGQLGLGDILNRGGAPDDLGSNLKQVDLGLPVLALSHGPQSNSACGLLINHEIKCWGYGGDGQLGYEDEVSRGGNPMDMGDNLPFVRYK